MRPILVAVLMAVPFTGVGATLTARAAGADPTVPSAPRGLVGAEPSGSTGARVSWKAPASDGGSPITGYTVIPYTGYRFPAQTPQVFNSAATTETLTGLKKAKAYRFKIVATNAIGNGPASAYTAIIVIGTPSQPATPTVKKVAKGSLKVSFHPPKNTNGAPITRYTATCTPLHNSRRNKSVIGHASPITVSVLAGSTYTCNVVAANSRGPSVPSPRSNKVKA